ncbi:MAG: DUF2283 domain-containing protein [Chloroflexota bacterium]|nr:DUF2283 domain-containing protein [Chloroflexota bacterium]MDE2894372.1 DUF2283 domain-containing protein [Chloroflexota bacterium]
MKATYFEDTDTLLIVFTDAPVADTRDLGHENLVDLDCDGGLVALTIEHARERNVLPDFEFEKVPV